MTTHRTSPGRATRPSEPSAAGLSIVVPVYNEAAGLPRFHERLATVARRLRQQRGLAVEVIYIDDGSRDDSFAVANGLPAEALDVQVVSLSRNFGKEAALMAGLDHARHGALLFMDGDGQHPADLIEKLVGHWLDDGYDVVYTAKANRAGEPRLQRAGVRAFYRLINWGARAKIPADAGDFRLLSPRAADALRRLPERNRFFKGLATWIGFKQKRVDYEPAARLHGRSTWSIFSLVGLSIEGITSFSVAPLRLASLLGVLLAGAALVFGGVMIFEAFFYGVAVAGYPSVIVGLMVLGGVQLVMIGVVGEYIGKILSEIKARPIWLCADDYGISPAVSGAIRELIVQRRLNATSVMVAARSFDRAEAVPLDMLNAGAARVAIGLHVTLTGPFKPMSPGFTPVRDGAFLPLEEMLRRALMRRLSRPRLKVEIATQLEAFVRAFGRAPDFIDGHQHVQLFPQVRDALLEVVKEVAPNAWVRQCGRVRLPIRRRVADKKALLLDVLSRAFRHRAAALGIATNPAFAGAYDFTAPDANFAALFPGFLQGMPAGGLIMCHPGRVDAELERLDPLTHQREREYDFLASDHFPAMLHAHGLALA